MIRTIGRDLQVLRQLLRGKSNMADHRQQLEYFYAQQAEHYDDFRARLLHGRQELIRSMEIMPEHTVVELGAGTGHNLCYIEHPLQSSHRIDIVDLCPSLLAIARERYRHMGNINIIEADASLYCPGIPVDRVYISYALTMIPDWKNTIDNAIRMLKPGGLIGVVDFYVPDVSDDMRYRWRSHLAGRFWKKWFAHDGVHLTHDHLRYLRSATETISLEESAGSVPYLPFLKAPYYIYVGQKTRAIQCANRH